MAQLRCSCLLQNYPHNDQLCGKEAKFSVDCHDTPLYLCKYHSNSYRQGKPITFSRMNYCLGYPEPVPLDPSASFLPHDCWKIIVSYLPKSEQYLAKFVCKLWAEIIGKKCCRFDFSHSFRYSQFPEIFDYLGVDNIVSIDNLYSLSIDQFRYLVNKGCCYSDDLFAALVSCGDIEKIMCILETVYIPNLHTEYELSTCNENIYKFLHSNGIFYVGYHSPPPAPSL